MNALQNASETPLLDQLKHALNNHFGPDSGDPIIYANPLTLAELRRESVRHGVYWPTGKRPLSWTRKDGYRLIGFPVCVDVNQKPFTLRISSQVALSDFLERQNNN